MPARVPRFDDVVDIDGRGSCMLLWVATKRALQCRVIRTIESGVDTHRTSVRCVPEL